MTSTINLKLRFAMRREAFKMYLKPGCEAEYEKRHNEIWPELKELLSDNGVYDYSIFRDKETNILFACQKVRGEESSQDMGANPVVQEWWDYMADIMEVNPDNSPVSIPLKEVFRME
jgi:L-rhamnose mutarotase